MKSGIFDAVTLLEASDSDPRLQSFRGEIRRANLKHSASSTSRFREVFALRGLKTDRRFVTQLRRYEFSTLNVKRPVARNNPSARTCSISR